MRFGIPDETVSPAVSSDAHTKVCVISGESGAGKTESAKLFMKQIIFLSTKGAIEEANANKGPIQKHAVF